MISRRERKKLNTRAALLRGAMDLFAERGILGTRVVDITERADLGKGAFYNYFRSKNALVAALIREGLEVLDEHYLEHRVNGVPTLETRVEQIVSVHEAFFRDQPRYMLLFHQARGLLQTTAKDVDELRAAFAEYLRRLGRVMPPPAERQSWRDEDLLDLAACVAGGIVGYWSMRLAAGLAGEGGTAREALARGVPAVMESWRQ